MLEAMQCYIEQVGKSLTEMFDYILHLTTSKKHTFQSHYLVSHDSILDFLLQIHSCPTILATQAAKDKFFKPLLKTDNSFPFYLE